MDMRGYMVKTRKERLSHTLSLSDQLSFDLKLAKSYFLCYTAVFGFYFTCNILFLVFITILEVERS